MAAPERYLFRIMSNSALEHFDQLFDRAEYRKANSKHHSSITKRRTGVAAAGFSAFRATAGRTAVNAIVRCNRDASDVGASFRNRTCYI
jgi:hypothetical protein